MRTFSIATFVGLPFRWLGSLSFSLRLLLAVAVPLAALVAVLAIFLVVKSHVAEASLASMQSAATLRTAKEVRDDFTALQLAGNVYVVNAGTAQKQTLTDAMAQATGLSTDDLAAAGLSADDAKDLAASLSAAADKRASIGDSHSGIVAALDAAGAALHDFVNNQLDTSDMMAPAITQSFYDMLIASGAYQAASAPPDAVGALAQKMAASVKASFLTPDTKDKVTGMITAYTDAFQSLTAARGDLDKALASINDRFKTVLSTVDSKVADSDANAAKANGGVLSSLADSALLMELVIGGCVAFCLIACWLLSRSITGQINRLVKGMERIAGGEVDLPLDRTEGRSEAARMGAAVEVFRTNMQRVHALTEQERETEQGRRREHAAMMEELRRSFGEVVDAAIAGDFGKRVPSEFPDAELNALARSINTLVATVDRGLKETGVVLAALADTDLTQRMNGDYQGAFGQLAADTNAVSAKLAAVVAEIRDTSRSLKTATGEILSGANDLSGRTTRQAATIEETNAAIEQLASTVSENANRAVQASRKAHDVQPVGDRRRRGHGARQRGDGPHHHIVRQDFEHYRADRRYRLPDQPAGAQRLGRSSPCRRGRQGFRRSCGRGAASGAVCRGCISGGQGADRGQQQ